MRPLYCSQQGRDMDILRRIELSYMNYFGIDATSANRTSNSFSLAI